MCDPSLSCRRGCRSRELLRVLLDVLRRDVDRLAFVVVAADEEGAADRVVDFGNSPILREADQLTFLVADEADAVLESDVLDVASDQLLHRIQPGFDVQHLRGCLHGEQQYFWHDFSLILRGLLRGTALGTSRRPRWHSFWLGQRDFSLHYEGSALKRN